MSTISVAEAELVEKLLEIISQEGLVDRARLAPDARIGDVGLSHDDLVLIGNAIEREFDRSMPPTDEELQQVETVHELVSLMGRRILGNEGAP